MRRWVPRYIEGKVGYYALTAETSISDGTWSAALASKDVALTGAKGLLKGERDIFSPQYLVVSLGVDAFENDPISFFKLTSADFLTTGEMIASLEIPTLFVMGGIRC